MLLVLKYGVVGLCSFFDKILEASIIFKIPFCDGSDLTIFEGEVSVESRTLTPPGDKNWLA